MTQNMIQKIVTEYRKAPANTKIYLGADSVRTKFNGYAIARISVVAVIHLASSKGCKVLGYNTVERVYDSKLGRPQHRMMLEVYEVSKLYLELVELLPDAPIEVHLDISANPQHGSSCAAQQAAGYILGVCQVTPILKPNAWAASTCADLFTKKLG
jgi:predicted RNase H-related nuclease YkuK (DUF458 family)